MKIKLIIFAFVFSSLVAAQEVKWVTLEQATKEVKLHPEKPVLINIYTTWCGFCKRLYNETLTDKDVVNYINKNYIAVRFDAETKEMVNFLDINYGRSSSKVNFLAFVLTSGQLGYPTTVIVNSKNEILNSVSGYRAPEEFIHELKM